jgi:hypothetical protein
MIIPRLVLVGGGLLVDVASSRRASTSWCCLVCSISNSTTGALDHVSRKFRLKPNLAPFLYSLSRSGCVDAFGGSIWQYLLQDEDHMLELG